MRHIGPQGGATSTHQRKAVLSVISRMKWQCDSRRLIPQPDLVQRIADHRTVKLSTQGFQRFVHVPSTPVHRNVFSIDRRDRSPAIDLFSQQSILPIPCDRMERSHRLLSPHRLRPENRGRERSINRKRFPNCCRMYPQVVFFQSPDTNLPSPS